MIKVQFKLPPNYSQTDFDRQMSLALRVAPDEVTEYKIIKKSLDCRDKSKIHYLMTVGVGLRAENKYLSRNKKPCRIRLR